MSQAATTAEKPFITLERAPGIVFMSWSGGPPGLNLKMIPHGGVNLLDFINGLRHRESRLLENLNRGYASLNRKNPSANVKISRYFNGAALWAYAMAKEMHPHCRKYDGTPGSRWLYHDVVYQLEEIYLKCWAASHVYGPEDESVTALWGILMDFFATISAKSNRDLSDLVNANLEGQAKVYVETPHEFEDEPLIYKRLFELYQKMGEFAVLDYPSILPILPVYWRSRLVTVYHGYVDSTYTDSEVASEARMTFARQLRSLADEVEKKASA